MEKKVNICDICDKKVATKMCKLCGKDICEEDSYELSLIIDTTATNILIQSCIKCSEKIDNISLINLKIDEEQLISSIKNNMIVSELKEEKTTNVGDRHKWSKWNMRKSNFKIPDYLSPFNPFKKKYKGGNSIWKKNKLK